ncbi:MAG: toxin [Sphingobacteriia bacterium]|nr:MAG: toxin [Sphingobacteriia bacterium]TAH06480.1 MAG: toxin [Sphingobacteriia bacterium]
MANPDEIKAFLNDFHIKMDIWGIVVRDDRGKNSQTLLDLEITKDQRNKVLKALAVEEYSEGPLPEKLYGGADMWVFGKTVKAKEIYIKITMGTISTKVICISFHVAEHPMNYPQKQ